MDRIRVEGSPEALEELWRELEAGAGDLVRVEPVSASVPGELREPLVVALLISFSSTAAVAIKTAGSIIERRMTHLERKELLRIYRERDDAEISMEHLVDELSGDG